MLPNLFASPAKRQVPEFSEPKKEKKSSNSKSKKKKIPEETKESLPENKKVKKAKYDRKPTRVSCFESVKMPWAELQYQPNIPSLQAKFATEFPDSSPQCLGALASAFSFNENVGLLRSRIRKESQCQINKKALSRPQFNQAQAFQTISYRPGTAFIQYQNYVGKAAFPAAGIFTKKLVVPNHMQSDSLPTAESGNENQFVCKLCRRSDAKKYAKDLCQTCYKKQKKLLELGYKEDDLKEQIENGDLFLRNLQSEILKDSQPIIPLTSGDSNWICIDCKRYQNLPLYDFRTDVKHYAKGRCGACYRKNLNKLKSTQIVGSENEQSMLNIGNENKH